ncbi:MAG: response regulator [Bryobacteraceae bacterium]
MANLVSKKRTSRDARIEPRISTSDFKTNPILGPSPVPLAACTTSLGKIEVYVPAGAGVAPMKCGTKTGTIHILIVEDNQADIYLIRASLSMGKIPKYLSVVTDGEEALNFLTRAGQHHNAPRPDLILLDLNLPKMDGREVLERIKEDRDLRQIPVLVLSTSRSDRDVRSAYEHHANCYLTKPSELDEYLDVVHAIESYWLQCVARPTG